MTPLSKTFNPFIRIRSTRKHLRKCGICECRVNLVSFYVPLLLSLLIGTTFSEFRFCAKGPHKIRETACPGGFIAFSPLPVTCMHYMKGPDISELTVKFDDKLCDGNGTDINVDLAGGTDLSGVSTFQKITFDFEDEFAEPSPGEHMNDETCTTECLKDWVNPFTPEDEPMFVDIPPVSDDEKEKLEKDYVARTRDIFLALIRDMYLFDYALEHDPILSVPNLLNNDTNTVDGFQLTIKLLAKSMRIAMLLCSPFVDRPFYENVLRSMIYLHEHNKVHFMVDMFQGDFRIIYKLLDECEKGMNTRFLINGTHCKDMSIVDTITNLGYEFGGPWKYRRQARSFRWGIYDPIVEAAWMSVDFVHGYCFPTFHAAEDVLHFHLYIQAMEALFPYEAVQKHWMYPVELKSDDFWNTMLDTHDIKNQMRNLDACAIAANLKKAPYQERLLRPFVQPEQIENPQYVDLAAANKQKGWGKSVADYWRWYETQGSFKEISKTLGHCLDGTVEDLQTAERDIMQGSELTCLSQAPHRSLLHKTVPEIKRKTRT